MSDKNKQKLSSMVWRALALRCPSCGEGKLFARYLKQVEQCSECDESYGHIRTDDGPAWLTILVVGHVVVSAALIFALDSALPDWVHMVVWPFVAVALILALLPSAKGLFITMIWRVNCEGANQDDV